jgi:hypothetical protein
MKIDREAQEVATIPLTGVPAGTPSNGLSVSFNRGAWLEMDLAADKLTATIIVAGPDFPGPANGAAVLVFGRNKGRVRLTSNPLAIIRGQIEIEVANL